MPGFSSMDSFINAVTSNNQRWRTDWNKNFLPTTAGVVGQWSFLANGAGNPGNGGIYNASTNLRFIPTSDNTTSTAVGTGTITTTVFTDVTHTSGFFSVGQQLTGTGVTAGTFITSLGTGTGANNGGTYNINISQTVASTAITGTASTSGIQHGGNVAPLYKSVINASAFTAAATVAPCILMLVDLIGYYRVTTSTTITSQALVNNLMDFATVTASNTNILTLTNTGNNIALNLMPFTRVQFTTSGALPTGISAATDYYVIKLTGTTISLATSYANAVAGTAISITSGTGSGTNNLQTLLPRYTNGAGVQSIWWANNAIPLGAGTPSLSYPNYTNSAQVTGRTTPAVLPTGKTAAENGMIIYSGTGVGKYGPFFPLAAGDSGIAKIDNLQISSTYTSGEFSVGLCVPILTMPITTLGVASERDLMNQIPSMPRIYDGANLHWMIYHGANTPVNSSIIGHLDFAWN